MAGGKHPAIRLGLSIVAVLLCALRVSVLGQAPSVATFRILETGTAIGSAEIAAFLRDTCHCSSFVKAHAERDLGSQGVSFNTEARRTVSAFSS
jgi:hypothetical protein